MVQGHHVTKASSFVSNIIIHCSESKRSIHHSRGISPHSLHLYKTSRSSSPPCLFSPLVFRKAPITMCSGTTLMTCGHAPRPHLHLQRCSHRNCTAVTGPQKNLNDTCARCHPSIVITEINRRHDSLRESLMRQLREAPSRDQARAIQKRVEEGNTERGKELREASKLKWEGVVDWGRGSSGTRGGDGGM